MNMQPAVYMPPPLPQGYWPQQQQPYAVFSDPQQAYWGYPVQQPDYSYSSTVPQQLNYAGYYNAMPQMPPQLPMDQFSQLSPTPSAIPEPSAAMPTDVNNPGPAMAEMTKKKSHHPILKTAFLAAGAVCAFYLAMGLKYLLFPAK